MRPVIPSVIFAMVCVALTASAARALDDPVPMQENRLVGINTTRESAWRVGLQNAAGRVDDPVGNGIAAGALIGAAAAVGVTAIMYSTCRTGCEAPAAGPTYLIAAGMGSGGGAVIGWLIDKAHKGRSPGSAAWLRVSPLVSKQRNGVTVDLKF